jgi:hypothetical protein
MLTTNPNIPPHPGAKLQTKDYPPGLTPHLLVQHLPPSTATDKGHMQWHHQGVQPTLTQQPAIFQAKSDFDCLQPTKELCSAQDMFCFAALADFHTGTMHTIGTCAFPVRSICNMQYVFVAYVYNLNAILVCAMPSKKQWCHDCSIYIHYCQPERPWVCTHAQHNGQ